MPLYMGHMWPGKQKRFCPYMATPLSRGGSWLRAWLLIMLLAWLMMGLGCGGLFYGTVGDWDQDDLSRRPPENSAPAPAQALAKYPPWE